MLTIGFVGLGNMGAPMSANLVKARYRVRGRRQPLVPGQCEEEGHVVQPGHSRPPTLWSDHIYSQPY
jgi:hypothetical protein